jgi:pyruvate, water dikinase
MQKTLRRLGQNAGSWLWVLPFPMRSGKKSWKDLKTLKKREESLESVAVRSSATAEDLPEASFAGQHESYMNIQNRKGIA